MFFHNFKYSLITLLKNRMLIFWTFAFPIILGTFFYLAFSNIENSEKLDIIDIAIVENETFDNNDALKQTFSVLGSSDTENQLFNIEYVDTDIAKSLLEEEKISGYVIFDDETPKIVVSTSGVNETVLKYAVDEIIQNVKMVTDISEYEINKIALENNGQIDYEKIYLNIMQKIQNSEPNITNISSSNLSYTMIEFYTLIAMTCLYGGILGMTSINQNLANMSSNGKRVSVSPINKIKIIFSSLLASYITQLIGLLILFVYTIFVLHVDYGNNIILIIILTLAGALSGLSIGVAIGTIFKTNENMKTGLVISITMIGCFLSGMMGITTKYIVDKNIPILNKINPASMITDGFYSLYYYDTLNRYIFNVASLLIFSFIMILLSYTSLRRQKYDSI